MRFWLILACCLLATGVFTKSIPVNEKAQKKNQVCPEACSAAQVCPDTCATGDDTNPPDDEDDDEPKRLVVYYNFEKIGRKGRIADKSGYENSGTLGIGGEILKFNDKEYTCNQAARLYDHDIILRGDTFQAKPKTAITVAAWIKLEERGGQHSIFDTIGTSHSQGQFHFEVDDGVVRWFHRDERAKVVFETMAHTVEKGKWTHVAATYDSKTKQAKIFINGEIRNQSIGEGTLSRDWGVRAGIGNREKHRPLRGSIDEFRIYNYALKNDEIKALVTACKGSATEDPNAGGNVPESSGTDQASTRTLSPTDAKEKAVNDSGGTSEVKGDEKTDAKPGLKK